MKEQREITIEEALQILERMRYEAEFNSLKEREEALEVAIAAVKKTVGYDKP